MRGALCRLELEVAPRHEHILSKGVKVDTIYFFSPVVGLRMNIFHQFILYQIRHSYDYRLKSSNNQDYFHIHNFNHLVTSWCIERCLLVVVFTCVSDCLIQELSATMYVET